MNEEDPLILYTNAGTRAIGGVLMQIQDGIENPKIFVSHVLSDKARWGIMHLELYAFVLLREHPCSIPIRQALLLFKRTIAIYYILQIHRLQNWCVGE